jgi:hypothetical protein
MRSPGQGTRRRIPRRLIWYEREIEESHRAIAYLYINGVIPYSHRHCVAFAQFV